MIRRPILRLWLGALFVTVGATPALATPITNNTGLAAPDTVITFSEHVFATGTPILNQYADLGVTFSPSLFYDVQPIFFPTQSLANFDLNGNISNPASVFFLNPVTAAAVAIQTNPGTTTFTALYLGNVVESFSAPTTLSVLPDVSQASNFYGFSGIVFDELRVNSGTTFFQMDNLQYDANDVVPEPATWLLLGSGLGLAALSRRLAKRT